MAYHFICEHLTKRFDTGDVKTVALQDINPRFEHGDFISIIGPSGSGKSTLLSCVMQNRSGSYAMLVNDDEQSPEGGRSFFWNISEHNSDRDFDKAPEF